MPNHSTQEDMQQTTKSVIARECLIFVVLLVVGLTIAPITFVSLIEKKVQLDVLPLFYAALFSRRDWAIAWSIALAPYIIYQLGRPFVWLMKTTKGR